VLKCLLDGADVNARDDRQSTPLHKAVKMRCEPRLVGLLLDAGADINARDRE